MKVSALEEYGLRCALQLAKQPEGLLLSGEELAHREGLTGAYVQKILLNLSRAGLVHSIRGIQGGYRLGRLPETITVGEVIRALGGACFSEICGRFPGHETECVHVSICGLRSIWQTLGTLVNDVLDKTTLKDVLDEEQQQRPHLMSTIDAASRLGNSV